MAALPATSRPFLVLATQASSAHHLMHALDALPGVQGHMELFYGECRLATPRLGCNDFRRFVEIGSRFARGKRPANVLSYLDRLYSRPGMIGFLLMYDQLREYPEILLHVVSRRIRIVHVVRHHHLDALLSSSLRAANDNGSDIRLDPAFVVKWISRQIEKQRRASTLLRCLPTPVLEVAREELAQEIPAWRKLLEFIGLNVDSISEPALRDKEELGACRRRVCNYREIRRALDSAGFQGITRDS